jgi:hypothetical protein
VLYRALPASRPIVTALRIADPGHAGYNSIPRPLSLVCWVPVASQGKTPTP